MGRPKGQSTMESWMIANGKPGELYSDKMDRHLTAIETLKAIAKELIDDGSNPEYLRGICELLDTNLNYKNKQQ